MKKNFIFLEFKMTTSKKPLPQGLSPPSDAIKLFGKADAITQSH